MNIYEKNGITLTELLVASILVGIVMLGVASFGVSIKQLQGTTNRSTIIAMRTKAAMARISKDAYLAVGDNENCGKDELGTDINCGWGVRYYNQGSNLSICFRQDVNESPDSYADDEWACYFRGGANDLYRCDVSTPTTTNIPVRNFGQCQAGGAEQQLLELNPADNVFYQVFENAGRLDYVEITLSTLFDTGLSEDPITNPEYTATTQISPPGHSRW